MARDKFSPATVRILAQRAGHRCSHPRCDTPTSGPGTAGASATVNVGFACHIIAAAARGPRPNRALSHAERSSPENGIWMCGTHAKLVDSDVHQFTVEILREWKEQAEQRALELVGVQPASLDSARSRGPRTFELERFSTSIVDRMAELRKTVEFLTEKQKQVLHAMRFQNQAIVTGCAGSGKTLLAVDRAIRLDAAGFRTLLLCHNPNLATHIRSLLGLSQVDVFDFCQFIGSLANTPFARDAVWTSYNEPTAEELTLADQAIILDGVGYDAIIVDEGQDFRREWWELVVRMLPASGPKKLYIFCDDNQALLPFRAQYPIRDPKISLSMNCRNSGEVFEVVKKFHVGAPPISESLHTKGIARVRVFEDTDWPSALSCAVQGAHDYAPHLTLAILTTERSSADSMVNGFEVPLHPGTRWRDFVECDMINLRNAALSHFRGLQSNSSQSELENRFAIPSSTSVEAHLAVPRLSRSSNPTQVDSAIVTRFASRLAPFFPNFSGEHARFAKRERTVRFVSRGGALHLVAETPNQREIRVTKALRVWFYCQRNWTSSIADAKPTRIVPAAQAGDLRHTAPLFTVDEFKGLEADTVVLFVDSARDGLVQELYVGTSRAIGFLYIVVSRQVLARLPALSDLDSRFLVPQLNSPGAA